MSDAEAVRAMFRQVEEAFGHLDILIANAAATAFRPLLRQGEHNVTRTFDLTITGTLVAVQEAVPLMAGRQGKIVTISGIDSLRMLAGHGLLGAAKAALENMTMYLAHELGPHGIAVNGINPGLIQTDSAQMYAGGEAAYAQYERDVIPQTPAGRDRPAGRYCRGGRLSLLRGCRFHSWPDPACGWRAAVIVYCEPGARVGALTEAP